MENARKIAFKKIFHLLHKLIKQEIYLLNIGLKNLSAKRENRPRVGSNHQPFG